MTQFLTLFADGLVLGSLTGLLAASFSLILSVTQRFHVAYITTFVLGAYAAVWANSSLHWSVGLSAVFGLVVAGLIGVLIEALVYRPIARHTLNRGANPLIPTFIASLGLSTLASNLLSIHFNTTPRALNIVPLHPLVIGNVHQTTFAVVEVVVCWVLVLALYVFLRFTQRGQWITAVRSSQELAATVGINVGRIFLLVFAIGSVISGVIGMMVANATFASPSMGFDQVFEGFLVAFLAGMDSSPIRMGLVGLVIGEITDLTQQWVNAALSDVLVFGILMLYVVYRSVVTRHPNWALMPALRLGRA